MGLTRTTSGLLVYDSFTTDTRANYTVSGPDFWSAGGGTMLYDGGDVARYTGLRRADISTAKCVTVRAREVAHAPYYTHYLGVGGSGCDDATYHQPNGYYLQADNHPTWVSLRKRVAGVNTKLGSTLVTPVTRVAGTYYLWRLYIADGHVMGKFGEAALGDFADQADAAFTQGHAYFWAHTYDTEWDWLDVRTAHTVVVTGLPTGYYVRLTDGVTAASAAESSGTATVDAGRVLFPLSRLSVYDGDPDAGGYEVSYITSGTLADMGGGDEYAYTEGGVYSWRVRATDEHGMVGEWSASDTFHVTFAGTLPEVTLVPIVASTDTTPRSLWSYVDRDGDTQTDYQIVTASDPAYTTDVVDSGVVASTNLYHQHAELAEGRWYRKLRIRTGGVDWSEWVEDTFDIVAPTSQTRDWEIYLDAEGTPTLLDPTTYPVSGLSVTRRLDAPTEFEFSVNNFDGLEGGIDDDEEIALYLRDVDGNRLEFRGAVVTKTVGLYCTVRCADIARLFERWTVSRELGSMTLGQVITAIIEQPTGMTATGIVCHVQECDDPESPGSPIRLTEFRGADKTVRSWLSEFQKLTGFRWYVDCVDGVWHFWWVDPEACPTWSVTLRDDIDCGDEDDTQWRLLDDVQLTRSRTEYANRIKYYALYEPPELPPGVTSWDELFTESLELWEAYSGGRAYFDSTNQWTYRTGAGSVVLERTIIGGPGGTVVPQSLPLGYLKIPERYRDFANPYFRELRGANRYAQLLDGADATVGFYGQPWLRTKLHSEEIGPDGGVVFGNMGIGIPLHYLGMPTSVLLNDFLIGVSVVAEDEAGFDINNVSAISFEFYWPAFANYRPYSIPEGRTWTARVWFDNYQLCSPATLDQRMAADYMEGLNWVETAAVTAGTEVPIEDELTSRGLTQNAARALALLWLDLRSRSKCTVSNLRVAGVRRVPMQAQVPLALTRGPVLTESYPLTQVRWVPVDADGGWYTEIEVGDFPSDVARMMESLGHGYKTLVADTRST